MTYDIWKQRENDEKIFRDNFEFDIDSDEGYLMFKKDGKKFKFITWVGMKGAFTRAANHAAKHRIYFNQYTVFKRIVEGGK